MVAIEVSEKPVQTVKRALVGALPSAKSSHITESLAAALGYKTNAAMRAAFAEDADIQLFDWEAFQQRLHDLSGCSVRLNHGMLEQTIAPLYGEGIFRTGPIDATRPDSRSSSKNFRAWQSVMVAGINEAIRRRLITIRPGDNRWISSGDDKGVGFHFSIEENPAYGYISDAGYDEISVKVTVWPTSEVERWGKCVVLSRDQAYLSGDLRASGWLERRNGAWLQVSSDPSFFCRRSKLQLASDFTLERPLGFAVTGPFAL